MKYKLIFFAACFLYALWGMAGVMELDVTRHGAVGDGKTLNTGSLQGAIDGLHARGGGVLRFPAGRYLCLAGEHFALRLSEVQYGKRTEGEQ